MIRCGVAVRLFLTVWMVYAAFLTTNVVRETYLAVALGGDYSVRVDRYLGLHPDLFEIPGRGSYINSNPGASMLGAVPYAAARPLIAGLFAIRPGLGEPKPPTSYDDPRPNRTRLMNEMRARGLDVRLALAAMATQVGLMAPLGALATMVLFWYLRVRYADERLALWLALLYAFGTPLWFRSAFLNQNALLAHVVLFAWMLVTWPSEHAPGWTWQRRWLAVGALLGTGVLLDYSAAPLAMVFGSWALWRGWQTARLRGAVGFGSQFALGAIVPILVLLGYQWLAFGSPWYPAQRYMPATPLSIFGWNGLTLPTTDLLWRNLVDPRYGIFAFCPMLAAALFAPFWRAARAGTNRQETTVALLAAAALWLFSSANQFANLQWNTGVRYLVPAVPLLFLVLVPMLQAMPRWGHVVLLAPTIVVSVAVSMVREAVPDAVAGVLRGGPTLPLLTVLQRTAGAYAPFLSDGVQPFGSIAVGALAVVVLIIWRSRPEPRTG